MNAPWNEAFAAGMKWRTAVLLTAACLSAAGITACGQSPNAPAGPGKPVHKQAAVEPVYPKEPDREDWEDLDQFREENEVEAQFAENVNEFAYRTALDLMAERKENAVYSPAGLYYALSLAAQGTAGKTAEELNAYLGIRDPQAAAEQAGRLYRWLYKDSTISKVKIATSLWQDRKLQLNQSFLDMARENYYAAVYPVDYSDPELGKRMGDWVKTQTNGAIFPDIKVNSDQVLHLMSTIYFYDEWVERFNRSKTAADTFYLVDGGTVETEFMNAKYGSHGFTRGEGFTRSSLGLKESGAMVFVLPDEGVSLDSFFESEERLREVLEEGTGTSGQVTFKIPKFNLNSHFNIKEMMEQAGIQSLFSDGDFSAMTRDKGIFMSSITQDGHISINEEGVEASAFTDIAYAGAAMPADSADMILDRPFLFGVTSQGVWLFIGVCSNPAA